MDEDTGWEEDIRLGDGPWTILRRLDSGRLWLYPFGVAQLLQDRHPGEWEHVLTDDDKDALLQMVQLANYELNQELKER